MMDRPAARRGFTIIELMVAVAILAIVAVQAGVGFMGLWRLARHSYDEASFAVAQHQMHDRLLFNLRPDDDGTVPTGLLSITNLSLNASGLSARGVAYPSAGDKFQLVSKTWNLAIGSDGRLALSDVPSSAQWLTPADIFVTNTAMDRVACKISSGGVSKLLRIDLGMKMRNSNVVRTQRIEIPLFRRIQ